MNRPDVAAIRRQHRFLRTTPVRAPVARRGEVWVVVAIVRALFVTGVEGRAPRHDARVMLCLYVLWGVLVFGRFDSLRTLYALLVGPILVPCPEGSCSEWARGTTKTPRDRSGEELCAQFTGSDCPPFSVAFSLAAFVWGSLGG